MHDPAVSNHRRLPEKQSHGVEAVAAVVTGPVELVRWSVGPVGKPIAFALQLMKRLQQSAGHGGY